MRINRWPGGNLDIEPGDMVLISSPSATVGGVWAEVEVADGEPERSPSWIPTPSPPAMFLGETAAGPDLTRGAQVLLDGRILNVPGLYLRPV
jgi:hypothetical protein